MATGQVVSIDMGVFCFDVLIEYLTNKKIKDCPLSIPAEKQ